MANGLMGLSNLLGQSSSAQSGGLMGGGVFSQPESRGQRRSRLLTDAIANAGQNPYARLGAAFGGLAGMGGRAAAEGLGIVDAPAEVQRNEAIRQVQQEVSQLGLDPLSNPTEFGQVVSSRFRDLGYDDLAVQSLLQARQLQGDAPDTSTFYSPEGEPVQASVNREGRLVTLDNRDITGQGFGTSRPPQEDETFVPLTPEEKRQAGINPDVFAQRNTVTKKIHTGGGQTINVGGEPDPAVE